MEFPGAGWSHEKNPKFELPTTPEEENALILERSKYLLEHIAETEKERKREREEHGIDHLTKTYTRAAFEAKLAHAFEPHRRKGEKRAVEASLIFIDLDKFKEVNDTLGHLAGDQTLKRAATLLHGALREDDVLGRYGGDEFVVLLLDENQENARRVAENLRSALDDDPELKKLGITGSFGVCSSSMLGADISPEKLVERADHALYVAKDGGRNRVEVYQGA